MRKAYLALAVAALAVAAVIGFGSGPPGPSAPADAVGRAPAAPSAGPPPSSTSAAAPSLPQPAAPLATDASAPPPLGSGEPPKLQADAAGRLVVDVHTRDELERLLALNGRDESLALLRSLESTLPPIALREAVNAYYAFQNYTAALGQVASPVQVPTNENEAAAQLDALHALRVQTFGADVATAYFGEEEAVARRLIAWMQANPMPGASLEEKAMRAQEAVENKP